MLLETCPFLLDCQICWHRSVYNIFFCIYTVLVAISPFSLFILFIWILSHFFLVSLVRGLSILFIVSKNQLLIY